MKNKSVISQGFEQNIDVLQFADKKLLKDKDFMLEKIKQDPTSYLYVYGELKNDK